MNSIRTWSGIVDTPAREVGHAPHSHRLSFPPTADGLTLHSDRSDDWAGWTALRGARLPDYRMDQPGPPGAAPPGPRRCALSGDPGHRQHFHPLASGSPAPLGSDCDFQPSFPPGTPYHPAPTGTTPGGSP